MFAVCVTTLLCWLAVSASAAPSCEDLLQPLDSVDFQHLSGSWPLVAGSFTNQSDLDTFNRRDSTIINFGASTNSSEVVFTLIFNINDSCQYMSTIAKLEGSSFTLERLNKAGTLLKASCDDCLLIDFDNLAKNHRRLYLFSKKREAEQKEMEELTAQAACLNMTVPLVRDPTKVLCPEQISVKPTPKAEEKTEGQEA